MKRDIEEFDNIIKDNKKKNAFLKKFNNFLKTHGKLGWEQWGDYDYDVDMIYDRLMKNKKLKKAEKEVLLYRFKEEYATSMTKTQYIAYHIKNLLLDIKDKELSTSEASFLAEHIINKIQENNNRVNISIKL